MEFALKPNQHTYEYILTLPETARCELIDGNIYNMAPPNRIHQKISGYLHREIANYLNGKECEVYAGPFGVFLLEEGVDDLKKAKNMVEPDIVVICDSKKLINEGCQGAPDFIIEITSPSSKRLDYVKKLALYDEFGVQEYWIVNPADKSILVYWREEGAFGRPQVFSFNDKVRVSIFRDLEIDFAEISLV